MTKKNANEPRAAGAATRGPEVSQQVAPIHRSGNGDGANLGRTENPTTDDEPCQNGTPDPAVAAQEFRRRQQQREERNETEWDAAVRTYRPSSWTSEPQDVKASLNDDYIRVSSFLPPHNRSGLGRALALASMVLARNLPVQALHVEAGGLWVNFKAGRLSPHLVVQVWELWRDEGGKSLAAVFHDDQRVMP